MFKRTCSLGLLLVIVLYVVKLIAVGFMNMELKQFQPVATIFLLDTSASNKNLQHKQEQTILKVCKRLDSEDHAIIYVVTEDAYNIYNGKPNKLVAMKKAMETRGGYDTKNWGTAYGLALYKAVGDALRFKEEGYRPVIVFLGDMENEGDIKKQINWNTLPKNIKNTLKYIPDFTLAFLYAHPQKLDEIRQTLLPVLKEKQLIMASEENVDAAVRKILETVGR